MSPIAFVMRTGSPVDKASFRYLAISLGLSRYLAAKASAVGVIFFPITFTSPSPSARAPQGSIDFSLLLDIGTHSRAFNLSANEKRNQSNRAKCTARHDNEKNPVGSSLSR